VYRQSKVCCNSRPSVSEWTNRLADDRLPALGHTVRDVAAELTAAPGDVMPAGNLPEWSREHRSSF
jgi:hypothetical protein